MKRTLVVRVNARFDIRDYADQYELKSTGLGTRFAQVAANTIDWIPFMPFLYAKINRYVRLAPIRRFPFAVLYRVTKTNIVILAVVPAKSDPMNWPVKP